MRTDSPSRFMVVLASACALIALACALAIGAGDAAGKKKKGGGSAAVVTSTLQSQIVSSGAVTVRGGKGKVAVFAGAKALTGSRKGKPGKSRSLPLNDRGRALLGGCSVGELTAVTRFKKGKKKSRRSRTVSLTRDLGICSVPSENPTAKPYIGPPIDTANSDRCDFLDPAVCLQPWPNDYFTVADASTDTGRRLNISTDSTPKNKNGAPIATTDQNRGDGFSPGNPIIVKLPQVRQRFENDALVTMDVDAATLTSLIAKEVATWGPLAKDLGLRVQ